jgi:hypothetical protein
MRTPKAGIPISTSGILTSEIFTFTLVTKEFVYALTWFKAARKAQRQPSHVSTLKLLEAVSLVAFPLCTSTASKYTGLAL